MTQLLVKPLEPRSDVLEVAPVRKSATWHWTELVRFAVVAAEFGLLVWIIRLFELESVRFANLAILAWAGFLIHHFLPLKLRVPFFVVLSLAGLKLVAGGMVTIWVTGIGLGLIAVCHLPIPFILRIGLLGLLACALASLRAGWISQASGINPAVWMILGSMFMFRLIIYLHDLRHRTAEFGPFRAMAYFFMLPNVCFPLFPLVDYKTFYSTYFNSPALRIYQTGLHWMTRGVVHLALYRLVNQYVLIEPYDAVDLGGVARYMAGLYLAYLKISGMFHLMIGMLHMFGFNLPETHHLYYLANGFADLWRRVNIYWKDFITKVIFYPAFFRLKRLGPTWAMVLATMVAMFFTYVLHAYQWFWIRGSILLTRQEALFWGALAVLLLVNFLIEARYSRRRALGKPRNTVWSNLARALKTVGTFVAMCLLWTAWTSQSTEELTWLARSATQVTPMNVVLILAALAGLGVTAVLFGHIPAKRTETVVGVEEQPFSWRAAIVTGLVGCGLLGVVALSGLQSLEGTTAGEILMAARQDRLNQMDADALRRGYYEGLDVTRFDENLAFLRSRVTEQWAGGGDRAEQNTTDILNIHEDRPGGIYNDHGRTVVLNRWGMRDRDYEKTKPPGICRIALLGSSHEFGCGVAENETFENLVEDRLNAEKARPTYEILNFAEPNYRSFQFLALLEKKVLDFTPDAVFLVVNASEFTATTEQVAKALHLGSPIPYDIITNVALEAGVDRSMSEAQIRARIGPHAREIVSWTYRRMADRCHRRGVELYLVYRPSPIVWNKKGADRDAGVRRELLELAEETRLPVIDLSAAFDSVKNRRSLIVSEWDEHCNVKGHRLLADELYKQMHDRDGNLLLRPRAPAAVTP